MSEAPWWQTGVIYQIYPRSFQDSNADGVGDLAGIVRRLRYLKELGVDAIWICPIFTSPMADFGYDVADYKNIDPVFGTLADFDTLLAAAHAHGLKIILDLVPNHTSDQHPWFQESRSSRQSAKRDWYIWRDPAENGDPPNNWLSEFGGSAWTFDPRTRAYYYHAFLDKQPDLNWRNLQVREAMFNVMRFWLNRGIDGFRVDVMWRLLKDEQFRDNPANPSFREGDPPSQAQIQVYTSDLPGMQALVADMRRVVDEFGDRVLIGEIYLPLERLVAYYGQNLNGAHLPFNFSLLFAPWKARALASLIEEYEAALPPGGWPNWVLGNHDRPRIAARLGLQQARLAAMLLLTLRGTPTLYYGDEIGLEQIMLPPDEARDPFERNVPGLGLGRDECRSPMQWDGTHYAGFSTVEPWLPVEQTFPEKNVVVQRNDASSIYQLYRRLLALRKRRPALVHGAFRLRVAEGDLMLFGRALRGEELIIALNFSAEAVAVHLGLGEARRQVLLSTLGDREGEMVGREIMLRAHEGVVIEWSVPAHDGSRVG
jgi:alpha-glucosidase